MEHLRVMREDLADQMATLGIVASIQYTWARANMASFYESYYLPHVLDWLFPWQRLEDRGIPIVGNNDFPACNRTQAMQTISILATRKMARDEILPDWMDGDQLTVEQGLRAMTITNAWVVFEEDLKGTITPGKLADLTVLSENPLEMDPFDVRDITIEMTIMDGIVRHNQLGINHTAIHDAGTFSMGIDDRGLWGQSRTPVGFVYNGYDHLYHGSILFSFDDNTIATATGPQYDYVTSTGGWMDFLEPGNNAAEEATVVYEDAADWHPAKIQVTQQTFMWQDEPCLLVKYSFRNVGENPISDIYLGQHMDFEINGWDNDMGVWEQNQGLNFAYMYDANETSTPYIGVAMFDSTGNYVNNSLSFNVAMRLNSGNEPVLSQTMRNGTIEPGTDELGDYAILVSSGPYSFDVGQSISPFMLAFVAGDNPENLKHAVNNAYDKSKNLTKVKKQESIFPHKFTLSQNYPNPFNAETTIFYELVKHSRVTLKIYNTNGQEIKTLTDKIQEAGKYSIQWDGKSNLGRAVSSGIYLLEMRSEGFSRLIKMSLLR